MWSYWQTWSWSSQTPVEKKGLAALFSVPCAFDNFSSQLLSGPQELFSPFFPSFISIPFVGPTFCFDITLLVLVQLFNHGIWHLNHLFFSLSHYAPLIPLLRFLPLLFQFYLFHSVLPTMLCSLIPAGLVITVFMSLLFLICKAVHSHCLNCYASCSWMQNESWVFLSSSWSSVLLIVQIFLFCPTNPNVVAWMQCRWRNLCFIDICTLCRGRTCVWHYTIKYRALVVPGNKELGSTHSFRWSQLEELSGDKALTGPFIYTANQHTHTNTHPYV